MINLNKIIALFLSDGVIILSRVDLVDLIKRNKILGDLLYMLLPFYISKKRLLMTIN